MRPVKHREVQATGAGRCSVAEHWPSLQKTLGSNPNPTQQRQHTSAAVGVGSVWVLSSCQSPLNPKHKLQRLD